MVFIHSGEPVVEIRRSSRFMNKKYQEDLEAMRAICENSMKVAADVLKVDFVDQEETDINKYFGFTKLGGVAHELGTIPLQNKDTPGDEYCLDDNLKLQGYGNVYVCDNSMLPNSPEVNPSLTLVALALIPHIGSKGGGYTRRY